MGIERQINLARHPITELDDSPGVALVERCRSRLCDQGAYVLEGFLRQEAVATILGDLDGVLENAFYKPKTHNPYLAPADGDLPASHPRNRQQLTNSATLAYDFIAADSTLERIYRWPPLREFIARTLGFEELHPYADALAAVNVLVYPPGTQTGWHFDNAHFVVTLMLQQAQRGVALHRCAIAQVHQRCPSKCVGPRVHRRCSSRRWALAKSSRQTDRQYRPRTCCHPAEVSSGVQREGKTSRPNPPMPVIRNRRPA